MCDFTQSELALLKSLSLRVHALELDNQDLRDELEAVTNELAYVDAYQENLSVDIEYLDNYISEVEDSVNMIDEAIFGAEVE